TSRRRLGNPSQRALHLGKKSRRARRLARQPRHDTFDHARYLTFLGWRQREPERLFPAKLAESTEGREGPRGQRHGIGGWGAPTDEPASRHVEDRLREWPESPTHHTPIGSRTVTEEIHGACGKARGDPCGTWRGLERLQGTDQESEERGMRIAIGAQP